MSTNEILTLLESERDRLDRAIEVLRGSSGTRVVKQGAAVSTNHVGAGRRPMSVAARKAQSVRMKAYWAAKRRKGAATASKKA